MRAAFEELAREEAEREDRISEARESMRIWRAHLALIEEANKQSLIALLNARNAGRAYSPLPLKF